MLMTHTSGASCALLSGSNITCCCLPDRAYVIAEVICSLATPASDSPAVCISQTF